MTEIKVTKCMNCGSGMEWEYHHTICTGEPEPPEADFWRGHCSDCGFTSTIEGVTELHDPDSVLGHYQTRIQLAEFRARKSAPKPKRKARGKAVDTSGMDADELKKVLGF